MAIFLYRPTYASSIVLAFSSSLDLCTYKIIHNHHSHTMDFEWLEYPVKAYPD